MELPLHGQLQLDEKPLDLGDVFTKEDIMSGRLSYLNEGDDADGGLDNFIIDVSDGIHHVPIKLNVDITHVDDEAPALVGVVGGILSIVKKVKKFYSFMFFVYCL